MAVAAYNTRPRLTGLYVDGKKRGLHVRLLMRFVPWKGDSIIEIIRKIIFATALVALVYFGAPQLHLIINVAWYDYINERKMSGFWNLNISDEMRDRVLRQRPDMLPEYIPHFDFNNDLIGHVLIPDITNNLPYTDPDRHVVNFLVYQTTNNDFYLDYNFEGNRSAGGAIFADFRNNFEYGNLPGNTVLYGHNVFSGTMFTRVAGYYKAFERRDITFYQRHPIIHFNTLYERYDWKVFAVVLFNTQPQFGDVYNYHLIHEFDTEDDFHDFVFEVMDRSVLFTDVDLMYGDHILTLSTCYYPYTTTWQEVDTRAVVFARRVRPGESLFVDVTKASHNTGYLPFDLQARRLGNTWNGRVWDYETYLLSYEENS